MCCRLRWVGSRQVRAVGSGRPVTHISWTRREKQRRTRVYTYIRAHLTHIRTDDCALLYTHVSVSRIPAVGQCPLQSTLCASRGVEGESFLFARDISGFPRFPRSSLFACVRKAQVFLHDQSHPTGLSNEIFLYTISTSPLIQKRSLGHIQTGEEKLFFFLIKLVAPGPPCGPHANKTLTVTSLRRFHVWTESILYRT